MKQYVVYITYYTGSKLPPWYIGSTYEEKIINGYNGTITSKEFSNIYKEEQNNNKGLFRTKIISFWKTREEAYKEELRLQIKHKVVNNKKYFNKSYANEGFGKDQVGENNSMFGRNHSQETKNTISKKNKINSEERARKQKITINKRSKETQLDINKKLSDIKKSFSETKKEDIVNKFKKNISIVESNGKTKASNIGAKSSNTKNKVQKNGKTIHQNSAEKAAITKKENGSMNGLKHPKCKRVIIYNEYNDIVCISDKSFKTYCLENELPFSIFNKSKQTGNIISKAKKEEFKKYIGWSAKYET